MTRTLSEESTPEPLPVSRDTPATPPPGAAIALVGAATLLFEILLTRIFSVTMWYHFAFVAISLALFGIAASGVVTSVASSLFPPERAATRMGGAAAAFGVTSVLSFLVDLRIPLLPFDAPGGADLARAYGLLSAKFLVLSVPFFFSGLVIALAFTHYPHRVHRTYFADLGGGALGCVLVVPLLQGVSGPSAIFFVAALALMAAALFLQTAGRTRLVGAALAGVLAALGALAVNEAVGLVRIERVKSYTTDVIQIEERPKVYERWHPVSRVAVHSLESSGNPRDWFYADGLPAVFPPSLEVTNDAGARTHLYPRMSPEQSRALFYGDVSDLVYSVTEQPDVLVVGVGGGKDVLSALAFGAASVVAVEMNPLMIDIVQEDFAEFTGAPYDDPRVEVVIDEGRNYIASRPRRYDVIKCSVTDTWAASAMGAYALTESYLYTVEAIRAFYDHLEPNGYLTIVRWYPHESTRLARLVHVALEGEDDVDVLMVRNPHSVNLILKRGLFRDDEVERLRRRTLESRLTWLGGPRHPAWESPPETPAEWADYLHLVAVRGEDVKTYLPDFPFDLVAPTDDRPFFFNPVSLGDVGERSYYRLGGYAFQHGRALALLLGLLKVSLAVAFAFVVLPLLLRFSATNGEKRPLPRTYRAAASTYFLMLGLGYLLVEIPMLQQFILFLGHPTYAVTVVLFALLLSSGFGSLLAGTLAERWGDRAAVVTFVLLLVLLSVWTLVLSDLLPAAIGLPFALRMVTAVLVLLPLGLLLGMPFPLGIRSLHAAGASRLVPWAWAVNGAASVAAPVVAMIIALVWGFSHAFYLGTAVYLAAALLLPLLRARS